MDAETWLDGTEVQSSGAVRPHGGSDPTAACAGVAEHRALGFSRMTCILQTMCITFSLPDSLAQRFLASVPLRERGATLAKLLDQEVARREKALEAGCCAANGDEALNADIADWQAFEDWEEHAA